MLSVEGHFKVLRLDFIAWKKGPAVKKTLTKKKNAGDELRAFEEGIISNAVHWTAYQFRGAFEEKFKVACSTREEAEAQARDVLKVWALRPVLIYAVDAEGRATPVTTIRASV